MIEMEPESSGSAEARPEDWVEPKTDSELRVEINEGGTGFNESEEMVAIRTRIEQGEPLTEELWTAYEEAGSLLVDLITEGDPAYARLEFRLAFAELKIAGGLKDDAWEDLAELAQTSEMVKYPDFGTRVLNAITKTNQ